MIEKAEVQDAVPGIPPAPTPSQVEDSVVNTSAGRTPVNMGHPQDGDQNHVTTANHSATGPPDAILRDEEEQKAFLECAKSPERIISESAVRRTRKDFEDYDDDYLSDDFDYEKHFPIGKTSERAAKKLRREEDSFFSSALYRSKTTKFEDYDDDHLSDDFDYEKHFPLGGQNNNNDNGQDSTAGEKSEKPAKKLPTQKVVRAPTAASDSRAVPDAGLSAARPTSTNAGLGFTDAHPIDPASQSSASALPPLPRFFTKLKDAHRIDPAPQSSKSGLPPLPTFFIKLKLEAAGLPVPRLYGREGREFCESFDL